MCWPTNIGGVDVVPLLGAIVVCYGGEGDQLWGSGRGAIAGCHCRVLCWGRGGQRVTAKLGEWTWCHCRVPL